MSQTPLGALTDLWHAGAGTQFKQATDPVCVPDGNEAILFSSNAALPLQEVLPMSSRVSTLSKQRKTPGVYVIPAKDFMPLLIMPSVMS